MGVLYFVFIIAVSACNDTKLTQPDTATPKEDKQMSDIPIPDSNDENSGPAISAKRAAPPEVSPLIFEGITYTLVTQTSEDLTSSSTLLNALTPEQTLSWSLELYKIIFDPLIETDVQEIYPASMTIDEARRRLTVTDEQDNKFTVDLTSRSLVAETD